MYELEASDLGMYFYHVNCSCPTVADNIVLISFSKCYEFVLSMPCDEYNANKSYVIEFQRCIRVWKLGERSV